MSPLESPRTLPLRNLLLPQMSDAKPVGTPPCPETPPPVNREEPCGLCPGREPPFASKVQQTVNRLS